MKPESRAVEPFYNCPWGGASVACACRYPEDKAVDAAYGWSNDTPELSDGEILRRLLALSQERPREGAQS